MVAATSRGARDSGSSRRIVWGLAAASAFLALYASWLAFRWIPASQPLVGDLAFVPVNGAAAWAAWMAARRCASSPRLAGFWRLISLALVAYLLADVVQTAYEVALKAKPYPSLADPLYLAFYPLVLAALLRLPTAKRTRSRLLQLGLDLATVALGGATVVWYLVLGPATVAADGSPLQTFFSIAYPVGDMVLIVGLAAILLRRVPASSRRALQIMAAGLVAFVVADLAYGYISIHGTYTGGDPVDILWMFAIIIFGIGALAQGRASDVELELAAEPEDRPGTSWIPYIAVAFGYGLLIITTSRDAFFPDGSLVVAAVVLTALVCARQLVGQRELVKVHSELRSAHDDLAALATTDALTGLANHRALHAAIEDEIERARRFGHRLAMLFIDVDHFKALNDSLGHAAGDAALRELGRTIPGCLRRVDLVGRWGGEEFVALLPETEAAGARESGERIRAAIADQGFEVAQGYHLTCSVGVAVYPEDATDRSGLLGAADQAMYIAKHLGRNQVVTAADFETGTLPAAAVLASRDESAMLGAVDALAAMVDARDHGTADHAADVAAMSTQLAFALGCDANAAHLVGLAARLHDIGKVVVPDAILKKRGPLTPEEWDVIKRHPVVGGGVAGRAPALRSIAPIIRAHHEHWDGTGYPDQLAGERIPLAARVIAVADAFSAMTSGRPYRPRLSVARARAELQRCAGTQFDPAVVAALDLLPGQDSYPAAAADAA